MSHIRPAWASQLHAFVFVQKGRISQEIRDARALASQCCLAEDMVGAARAGVQEVLNLASLHRDDIAAKGLGFRAYNICQVT